MRSWPDFSKRELDELYTDQGISARFDVFNARICHELPKSQSGLRISHQERKKAASKPPTRPYYTTPRGPPLLGTPPLEDHGPDCCVPCGPTAGMPPPPGVCQFTGT